MVDRLAADNAERLLCVICSRPLGVFPEDQPDWPTGPLCGDCYQAQQMDDEIFWDEFGEG